VCGLPGSGKTTLAKKLQSQLGAVRFCPDEWMAELTIDIYDEDARARIEALQWKIAKQLLKIGIIVIIEWGTWAQCERDTLRLEARELGAAVELHTLTASPEALFERIQLRGMESPPIDWERLMSWCDLFQEPSAEERWLFDPPCC
jgi:predicted kinase